MASKSSSSADPKLSTTSSVPTAVPVSVSQGDAANILTAVPVASSQSGAQLVLSNTPGYVLRRNANGQLQCQQAQAGPTSVYYTQNMENLAQIQKQNDTSNGDGFLFLRLGQLDMAGRMIVPRKMNVVCVMHGSNIDLSEAQFVHPVTEIVVTTMWGGCKVILPQGVHVKISGVALLGSFGQAAPSPQGNANDGMPLVVVKGVSMMGSVEVEINYSKPPIARVNAI